MKFSKLFRSLGLSVALLAGAGVATVPAVSHAAVPAVGKLAMVDMQRVLNETSAGKKARKNLEASSKAK